MRSSNTTDSGQMPVLIHDGTVITESVANMLYLTGPFLDSGLALKPETTRQGAYLTRLFRYQGALSGAAGAGTGAVV